MNIAVCLPCLLLGGSEIATLNMISALKKGGYEIRVCCYYEHEPEMVTRFRQAGAHIDLLKRRRGGIKELLCLTRHLRKYLLKHQPDVVHVQYLAPGMVPIIAARLAGVDNIFSTVHAAGNHGYNWKAKILFRISAFLTDHFFCVSQNTEQFWFGTVSAPKHEKNIRRTKHSTIHNCVDTDNYHLSFPAIISDIPVRTPIIGMVGRVVELKGHRTLIHALSLVKKRIPDVRLIVIGTGEREAHLKNLARKLGVGDCVFWAGQVAPENLPGYYKAMDVLAMPSLWEGFGLTAAEAMAAGKPVVGTDVPGLREVIAEGETGFLVGVNDSRALADRLTQLLQDKHLRERMGCSASERVQTFFSKKAHDRKWLTAYKVLTSG